MQNTKDNLVKFNPKSDVGTFLGYLNSSKAYRVYNKRTLVVEESIHVTFDESNPSFAEKVVVIDNDADKQKSYINKRRWELEFEVRDRVFIRISPWKGVLRFGKRGKLSPRYIGPYEILECIGLLPYRLALLPELSRVHDVFHVSML